MLPLKESPECLLVDTIHEKTYPQGYSTNDFKLLLAIRRLFYNACTEGLVTTVLALSWITPETVRSDSEKVIIGYIIFVAFKCRSTKFKVELELRAD